MNILIIPDPHIPFHHKDSIIFLESVLEKKFKNSFPDEVIFLGDESDGNSWSFHQKNPNSRYTPIQELQDTRHHIQDFFKLFRNATILESNHGSLFYRKILEGELPNLVLKSMNDILEVGNSWKWVPERFLTLDNGQSVLFKHQMKTNAFQVALARGVSYVQGHFHTKMRIEVDEKMGEQIFGMTCGCLIDFSQYAFDYARNTSEPVKLGCAAIIDDKPVLFKMGLKANNRWNGKII